MKRNDDALTVEPCDICGDVGYPELIVTCSKCNVIREHCYCMRILLKEVPDVWFCECCQSKDGSSSPCKVNQDFDLQASNRQLTDRTGKVKFLHEDEVIKVSSGNFPVKPIPASSNLLMTRKAYVGSKNVIPKIPFLALKSNPCISVSPMVNGLTKEHRLEFERQVCASMLDRKVQTLNLQVEKPAKGAPYKALSVRKAIPIAGSGAVGECNRSDTEKKIIQSIQEKINHHGKYLPSSIGAWRMKPIKRKPTEASGRRIFHDGIKSKGRWGQTQK